VEAVHWIPQGAWRWNPEKKRRWAAGSQSKRRIVAQGIVAEGTPPRQAQQHNAPGPSSCRSSQASWQVLLKCGCCWRPGPPDPQKLDQVRGRVYSCRLTFIARGGNPSAPSWPTWVRVAMPDKSRVVKKAPNGRRLGGGAVASGRRPRMHGAVCRPGNARVRGRLLLVTHTALLRARDPAADAGLVPRESARSCSAIGWG